MGSIVIPFLAETLACFVCVCVCVRAFFVEAPKLVGMAQTVFLDNRVFVFVPCHKGAVLTRTAKMTNLHSTH